MATVQLSGVTKRFGELLANDHIDFDVNPGEIHALLGENGAGKTTLMRILYGLYRADSGRISIRGVPAQIESPGDAIRLGIGMVTQHFTLVPNLSVTENIILGHRTGPVLDLRRAQAQVAEASERYGLRVEPAAIVRHLSVGEQQRVEILKALYRQARVLILDEPTAVLVPHEVEALFVTLNRLRDEGLAITFISHKLNEVMAICDRITVLRAGRVAGTVLRAETTQKALAKMMVGREALGVQSSPAQDIGPVLLELDGISAKNQQGIDALKNISIEIHAGEILGLAGVSGNGQSELAGVLFGTLAPSSGRVRVAGKDLTGAQPSVISRAGVGRIPEDRQAGLVAELSVAENLALERLESFVRHGTLDKQAMRRHADQLIKEFQIKASAGDRVRTLSGGNMQKVILARTLSQEPSVVVASQPTRGLDIGATEYMRRRLVDQRDRGAAVLLISEDLDEITSLADRIAVIYEGQIVSTMPSGEATPQQLGLMMTGAWRSDDAQD
jgi:ABC-type uncharacterized transport system ATPase subunit